MARIFYFIPSPSGGASLIEKGSNLLSAKLPGEEKVMKTPLTEDMMGTIEKIIEDGNLPLIF